MWVSPLWKRQPLQVAQRLASYGQSNLFERMFSGTLTSIPPTASISFSNEPKSTRTTWFTCSDLPKSWSTVWIASFGPPSCIAALIF
jgi:hypothetical protein